MQFIHTNIGMINLAFVRRIASKNKGAVALLYLDNGEVAETSATYEATCDRIGVIVPDTTGCTGIGFDESGGKIFRSIQPILAWRVDGNFAWPILPGGDSADFIQHKDGKVDELSICIHDNIEDAEASFIQSRRR